jgi:hypothetical protein
MHPHLSFRLSRRVLALGIGVLILLAFSPAFAQAAAGAGIDWLKPLMGLLGGLALFLFGMEQLADGLKAAAGESLKNLMERLTKNRISLPNIRDNPQAIDQVRKDDVHLQVDQALQHQVGELRGEAPPSIETFRLEMEVVDKYKRIYALCKRIAKGALPQAVEVAE